MKRLEVKHALVRGVPDTYQDCIKPNHGESSTSKGQGTDRGCCEALKQLGVDLVRIEPDERFPDCCFVEDTAIVLGDTAIVAHPAVESRCGEAAAVREVLRERFNLVEIAEPGFIDGGDVLSIGDKMYVGLSGRTNEYAVEQVACVAARSGAEVVPVEIRDTLHLKTVCSYIGGYQRNGEMIEAAGFTVVELEMSEFKKGGGGLTCLSILF